ncbi:TPA: hypothetical protein DCX16_05720 [bacterium]|nr:hypothetical protein [bacterium]
MHKKTFPKDPKEAFNQAKRYFANAKETLTKSPIEYGIYKDEKYVKEASAMGYLSALSTIDGYLLSINTPRDKLPTSIEEYTKALYKIPHNGKLMAAIKVVYENLHIFGYYRGGIDVNMIKSGFKSAKFIIDVLSQRTKNTEGVE